MIQMGLDAFLHKVAAGLGVSDAANDALTFVRLSGVEALLDRPTAYSDVAPGPVPLELSFSQARAADLRLLAEPCVPGEGILARTVMGIEAVYEVTAAMFSPELAVQTRDLVRSLLPDGEEVAHLNWRSSIWLALRTTGGPPAVRIYVNAQFRDAEDRWFRIGRALSSFGFRECGDDLKRFAARRANWSSLLACALMCGCLASFQPVSTVSLTESRPSGCSGCSPPPAMKRQLGMSPTSWNSSISSSGLASVPFWFPWAWGRAKLAASRLTSMYQTCIETTALVACHTWHMQRRGSVESTLITESVGCLTRRSPATSESPSHRPCVS